MFSYLCEVGKSENVPTFRLTEWMFTLYNAIIKYGAEYNNLQNIYVVVAVKELKLLSRRKVLLFYKNPGCQYAEF